jgi:Tol biopolymer transport system component
MKRGVRRILFLYRAVIAALTLCLLMVMAAYRSRTIKPRRPESVQSVTESVPPLPAAELLFVRDGAIWRLEAGRQRRLIDNAGCPTWSPDHKRIGFVRGRDVWIASRDGKGQRPITRFEPSPDKQNPDADAPEQITWHPLRNLIAFGKRDHYRVQRLSPPVWDMSHRTEAKEDMGVSNIYASTLEPDRESLWLGNGDSGLPRMSLVSTACPCFSHDGKWIAFARNGDLWVAQLYLNGPPDRLPDDLSGTPDQVAHWDWSESRLTAAAHYDGGAHGSDDTSGITRITWSSDGKWIAYNVCRLFGSGERDICIVPLPHPLQPDFIDPEHTMTPPRFIDSGYAPCFSPDSKWLAYEDIHGDIVCVTTDGKHPRRLVENGSYPCW